MRLAFLGTPSFAVPSLERLVAAGHVIAVVYTQPDRPKGRGRELTASPVKLAAGRLGLAVHQPERIRRPEVVSELASFRLDAMVVVGYGQILPQSIIDVVPLGIVNIHASLLPEYRGAAPIQWAVAKGESVTGVTTMRIDAGLDTGDILLQRETPIGVDETAVELGGRLAESGADLLLETMAGLEAGRIVPRKQDDSRATYAPILRKEDGQIDWKWTAPEIYNRGRGFLPWPGIWTMFHGQLLHIWNARVTDRLADGAPGTVVPGKRRMIVNCGSGSCLDVIELQLEGKKRMTAEAFLNGRHLEENEVLGGVAT